MKGIFERLFGKPAHEEKMTVGGIFHLTCYKDASMKEILWEENAINKVTNQGLDNLGSTYFYSTAKLSNAWYLALVNTNTTATAAMTYATPVYTESTADGHRQVMGFWRVVKPSGYQCVTGCIHERRRLRDPGHRNDLRRGTCRSERGLRDRR